MGLFDHLFKPRPDGTVDRVVETSQRSSRIIEMREEGAVDEPPPDPATAFLHPKGYSPGDASTAVPGSTQGFAPVLPSAKRVAPPDRRHAPRVEQGSASNVVILCVGDVLSKLPVSFLRPGPHDLKRELRFRIDDLASDITRGRPAIALSCIAEQAPELFHSPIGDAEDMAIRLPLQKLVEQIGRVRAPTPPPAPALPQPPVQPPVPPPLEKRKPEPALPVVEKKAELIPPPIKPSPVVIVAPPPAPAPEVVAPEPPRVEPPVEAAAVIFDEPPPEAARPVETSPLANVIDLSLAAIVVKVPRELLSGPLPHIDEGIRISLPFPLIERQLGTGTVSISAQLFWSALPPLLKHHFVAREGIAVPLPLEEIFQNLPVGRSPEKPRFEPLAPVPRPAPDFETPIVLAPVPLDEQTPEFDLDTVPPVVAPIVDEVAAPAPEEPPPSPEPVVESDAVTLPISPEGIVLTGPTPAEVSGASAASAPPTDAPPVPVTLQPFRIFHPSTTAIEPSPQPAEAAPIVLGESTLAPVADDSPLMPSPDSGVEAARDELAPPAGVEAAEETAAMSPPVATPVEPEPPEAPVPHLTVLASPAPEPEELAAFNPDQPPPLKVEAPAAAVAILRGTIPALSGNPDVAMATGTIQPPRMFRPTVLPPPVSGMAAAPPIILAPTLAGPGSIAGMISLSPAANSPSAAAFTKGFVPGVRADFAPPPPPEPPMPLAEAAREPSPELPAATPPPPPPEAPEEPAPTLKSRVKRLFTAAPAAVAPAAPPPEAIPEAVEKSPVAPPPIAPTPPPPFSMPAATVDVSAPPAPEPAPFHLQLPPLPPSAPAHPPLAENAPPALPMSRFDQHSLQSLFMTDETLDLPKISRLAAALPGIQACVIATQGKTFPSGVFPEGFDLSALRGLSPQVGAAADRLPIGTLKNFTLYGEQYSISFFERPSVCICAIHRARSFVPGVREKIVAIVDELARV